MKKFLLNVIKNERKSFLFKFCWIFSFAKNCILSLFKSSILISLGEREMFLLFSYTNIASTFFLRRILALDISGSPFSQRTPWFFAMFGEDAMPRRCKSHMASRRVPLPPAICIFCAFRYLSKRVLHLAFRGQYYTLCEHNRSSIACHFPPICPYRGPRSRQFRV